MRTRREKYDIRACSLDHPVIQSGRIVYDSHFARDKDFSMECILIQQIEKDGDW